MNKPAWAEGKTIGDTGMTGSSASPYTEGRPEYQHNGDTGYTGSSGAPPVRNYRDSSYDTRPGMYKDKNGNECKDK